MKNGFYRGQKIDNTIYEITKYSYNVTHHEIYFLVFWKEWFVDGNIKDYDKEGSLIHGMNKNNNNHQQGKLEIN